MGSCQSSSCGSGCCCGKSCGTHAPQLAMPTIQPRFESSSPAEAVAITASLAALASNAASVNEAGGYLLAYVAWKAGPAVEGKIVAAVKACGYSMSRPSWDSGTAKAHANTAAAHTWPSWESATALPQAEALAWTVMTTVGRYGTSDLAMSDRREKFFRLANGKSVPVTFSSEKLAQLVEFFNLRYPLRVAVMSWLYEARRDGNSLTIQDRQSMQCLLESFRWSYMHHIRVTIELLRAEPYLFLDERISAESKAIEAFAETFAAQFPDFEFSHARLLTLDMILDTTQEKLARSQFLSQMIQRGEQPAELVNASAAQRARPDSRSPLFMQKRVSFAELMQQGRFSPAGAVSNGSSSDRGRK